MCFAVSCLRHDRLARVWIRVAHLVGLARCVEVAQVVAQARMGWRALVSIVGCLIERVMVIVSREWHEGRDSSRRWGLRREVAGMRWTPAVERLRTKVALVASEVWWSLRRLHRSQG